LSNQPKKSDKHPNRALKYAGMAFQMAATIVVGVLIGKRLDAYWEFEKPVITAVGALLGLVTAFYLILKDLTRQ
jgi:F0F1-type ATP synthase assembly protein I